MSKIITSHVLLYGLDVNGQPRPLLVGSDGAIVGGGGGGGGGGLYNAYARIQDQKAQNTNGGTFTAGGDVTRVLNTIVEDEASLVSLASNQITLQLGRYYAHISAPAYAVDRHRAWLYDTTGAQVLILGRSTLSAALGFSQNDAEVVGEFEIAVESVLEVRHRCETTSATLGLGVATNLVGVEIYTSVELWRLVA